MRNDSTATVFHTTTAMSTQHHIPYSMPRGFVCMLSLRLGAEATVEDLDADMDSYFGAPEAAEAAEPAETTDAAAVRALAPRTLACHLICPLCRCSRALLCPCHLKGLR